MRNTGRLLPIVLVCILVLPSAVGRADILTGETFARWGRQILTRIDEEMARSDGLYTHSVSQTFADYAWGQGVMLHALNAAAAIDSSYLAKARRNADEFHLRYWCSQNGTSGYNASYGGCGDRYYDDNAWIALALLELYELTGDSRYLTWARETVAFCMTGENGPGGTPDGGIRWHESNTTGASVCATAPTILANFRLYQLTGIASYYTDGRRLYDWIMASDLRYPYGIFHETAQGPLAYQTAVMTQCAVRLRQITGEAAHLREARRMAAAMETTFISGGTGALAQHGRWGGHDMTNACADLYAVDGDSRWLDLAARYLEHLYVNGINGAAGLYPERWEDTSGVYSEGLIDNAAVARAFWRMAATPGGVTPFDSFAPALRGRWTLDETSGTVAADSSGFGQPGLLGGGASFSTQAAAGRWNGALAFDGVNDFIDLPDGFADFRGGMTVSVWAYPTAVKNWARFLDLGNGEYDTNIVFGRRGSSNDLFFEAYDGAASGGQVLAPGAIQLNQWQMFTAALDADGNVTLYRNGTSVATGRTAIPSYVPRLNNYIGRSNWAADAFFAGRMDDVRIYNYALSPQEVAAIYQSAGQAENPAPANGAAGVSDLAGLVWTASSIATGRVWSFTTLPWPTQGLMAHYPMDAAFISGQTVIDTSGCPHLGGSLMGPATGRRRSDRPGAEL